MRALLALFLVAALFTLSAPAQQPGAFALKNPRLVHGLLGQERKDNKFVLGDTFWLAYDIDGLQTKEDGTVLYSIGMELTGKDGKAIFKQAAKDLQAVNSLGGGRKPAFAYLDIGTDTPPGEYTVALTVTDRLAKKTDTLNYKFEVLPPRFGIVQAGLSLPELRPTPPIAVPGQELWVHFGVIGFELDQKKQPSISITMDVIDQATGKGVLPKPITGDIKEVADEQFKKLIPWYHPLFINRTGKFKVQVKATDNNGKKSANLELDFEVLAPK
jgi:hypothetical protein